MGDTDPLERLEGATIGDRFRLGAFVARGGYGAVYRSEHPTLACPVAVKVLAVPEDYLDTARERFVEGFEREARLIASLRHPSIVRVLDFGVTEVAGRAHPFMVLEWIEGQTLEAMLREAATPRSPREAMALLRPVLDAIAAAHEQGVAHRDLKPANVMVTPERRGDRVTRVLDFGVAKAFSTEEAAPDWAERTCDPHGSFSLSHAAPEQVARLRTGPWTDVHALALLLVEVILGRRAYAGHTAIEIFASISAPRRPTPGRASVEVGPWEPVLDRALALVPGDRHPDAVALLADLDATLDAAQRAWESARAAPPAALDTPSPPPAAVAARPRSVRAAAVLVAGLAALGVVTLASRRARARHEPPRVAVTAPTTTPAATAPPPAPPPVAPPPPAATTVVLRAQPPARPPARVAAPRGVHPSRGAGGAAARELVIE